MTGKTEDTKTETAEQDTPRMTRVGRTVKLVKGGGGMSGQDISWYYYFNN
ncbi:hypothetical protein [Aestuariivirga sp.]